MKRHDFLNMVQGLFNYFRYSSSPSIQTIDDWHESLKYIDAKSIPYIRKQIEELENLPRNLPKIIKGVYEGFKRQNYNQTFIKYDEYDDPRYPVEKLHTATEIYASKGQVAFMKYCKLNYMPSQDIERVENKVKVLINRGAVKEIIDNIGYDISKMPPGHQKEAIRGEVKQKAQENQESFEGF